MKKIIFVLALTLLSCCELKRTQIPCGEFIPVAINKRGVDTSFWGLECSGGRFKAVPTGPWYVCDCEGSK